MTTDTFLWQTEIPRLNQQLSTKFLGRKMRCFRSLPSTNLAAREIIEQTTESQHGTLVLAETQTAGRGRLNRQWFSPPEKNLYLSLIIAPRLPQRCFAQIAVVSAVSLHEALLEFAPENLSLRLKWPNDLTANGKKICGILCEGASNRQNLPHLILGLGLNLNSRLEDFPPELRDTAASWLAATGLLADRAAITAAFLNHLEKNLAIWEKAGDLRDFMDYWRRHDSLAEQPIKIVFSQEQIIPAIACGIDSNGLLLYRDQNGLLKKCCCGDIIHCTRVRETPTLSSN